MAYTEAYGQSIRIDSSAYVDIQDGGFIRLPVITDTSSANLSNFGITVLTNNSSAPTTFTLDAPSSGLWKSIRFDNTFGTSSIGYIDSGAGVSINSTERYMTCKEPYGYVTVAGLNTTSWVLLAKSTGVVLSTGAT